MSLEKVYQDAEQRMKKSVENFIRDVAKLRTGRAHPSLVEHIVVSYYGTDTPLNQVANIVVEDARTLSITPWDKSAVAAIDKAIRSADLGLNPATAGQVIRVPLPPLTEERRKELIKMVHGMAEEARVAIRNVRRDGNTYIKDLEKKKVLTEDEVRRAEEKVQKITDKFIAEIDKLIASKEAELMHV